MGRISYTDSGTGDDETIISRLSKTYPFVQIEFDRPRFRSKKLVACYRTHAPSVGWQRIDCAFGGRDDEALVIHSPAAIILSHVDLVGVFHRRLEGKFQWNRFTDMKFLLDSSGTVRWRMLTENYWVRATPQSNS